MAFDKLIIQRVTAQVSLSPPIHDVPSILAYIRSSGPIEAEFLGGVQDLSVPAAVRPKVQALISALEQELSAIHAIVTSPPSTLQGFDAVLAPMNVVGNAIIQVQNALKGTMPPNPILVTPGG